MALACRCAGSRLAVRNAQASRVMPLRSSAALPSRKAMQRSVVVRAVEEDTSVEVDKLVKDLQEKWDAVENKTSVLVYGGASLVALWTASTILSAVDGIPLLPKILELVGLVYSAWFVYRYLLFKSSREELISDVEELKKKISGTE